MLTTTVHWKRTATLLLAVAIVCAAAVTLGVATATADDDPEVDRRTGHKLGKRNTLIYDQFRVRRDESRDLDGREPDRASIGSLWGVELGDWEIVGRRGGSVVEGTDVWWQNASDKRVNIDAETANLTVTSKIRRGEGYQYFGVTARHNGPVEWLGAWFDPEGWPPGGPGSGEPCPNDQSRCGAIVLGAKDPNWVWPDGNTHPGWFVELLRARYEWRPGKKRTISLAVLDDLVQVQVNGKAKINAEFSGLGDATEVGLFSRGAGETKFENFKVTGRVRFKKIKTPKSRDK